MKTKLLPSQQKALDTLERDIAGHHVAILTGRPGAGTTTILRDASRKTGRRVPHVSRVHRSISRPPSACAGRDGVPGAQSCAQLSRRRNRRRLQLDLLRFGCSHSYPRVNFLAAAMVPLVDRAQDDGKTLVFAAESMPIPGLYNRVPTVPIPAFTVEDYAALSSSYLGAERSGALNMRKVHRFAPSLNARQIFRPLA